LNKAKIEIKEKNEERKRGRKNGERKTVCQTAINETFE